MPRGFRLDSKNRLRIPPGETIRELAQYYGTGNKVLAMSLGITYQHVSELLDGDAPLTPEIAAGLEKEYGPSAEFWLNLEKAYRDE